MEDKASMTEEPPDTYAGALAHLLREARAALIITLLLALLAGGVFPALVLGGSQMVFPDNAGGRLLRDVNGEVIGSESIGQRFTAPRYFHGRPSAAGAEGYDAAASSGLNLGPTNEGLLSTISERAAAYRSENGLSDDIVLPADAVTISASGLDPHISKANALLQVPRVAQARSMPEAAVRDLVEMHADGPALGFLGEQRVNVLLLNLALDEVAR
jgi:K+-transporting ATPase ATPase C chain